MGIALSTCAAIARAEEPRRPVRVAVAWTRAPRAERCISPDELVTKTRARAASDTSLTLDREGADFLIFGRIEPRGEGFRTELVLRDALGRPLGERSFDSPARSCRALDDSLSLALVLLMETPRVRDAAQRDSTEELVELAPPLRSEARPAVQVAPLRLPPPRRRPWMFELGRGGSVAFGVAPSTTPGASLFGLVRPPGFLPIALRGTAYPFGVDRDTVPGEGIAVRGFVGGAEVCPLGLARSGLEVLACGGAHLAVLRAEPLGPRSNAGDLLFPVLPVRAEVRARLGAVSPYAAVTARVSPTSPGFVYRAPSGEERTSFSVPWFTVALDVGVAWHVP